jgi:hypothetical protein
MPVPEGPAAETGAATTRVFRGAPALATSPAPATSSGTEPIAGGNTDWVVNTGSVAEGPIAPGISNGANPFLTRPVESPAPPASARRKDYSLNNALRAQDAAKGLGPDGPVLRALEEETRTSLAPVRGNATFRAIVDATGTVTGLRVLDSTGDTQGWDDARQRAFAALQKKKLDVRGTNGALIDIHVESDLRFPSGAKSRVEVTGPLSLGGDLADIGAKPQRVVHARLSNYTPL